MSKRFTLKSVFSLVVILLTALVLVACGGENDQELVDLALDSVVVPFATGDSATSVTQNLTLPTTSGDITITWVSNSPAVISNAGVVTRPAVGANNATVVLTATLTLGEATATKDFTVVVPAMVLTDQQVVDAAVTSLAVTYATSDMATSVTGNVSLPASVGTVAVAWTSSNAAVISNAGVVTRPAAGEDNVTVTLTAALSKGSATGSKTFTLTVIALPVLVTDQDRVDDALSTLGVTLAASDTLAAVTQNVTLAMMSGTVTVSWASNNAAVISNAGVVTRPAKGTADATVLLTATLTLNDVTETKVFTLIVKALPYTALDALDMITIEGTTLEDTGLVSGVQSYSTTSNVVLPTSVLGFEVEWSTTNAAVLAATGVVVRPAYGQDNSTIILTATVLEEELTFIVTVLAIVDKPVELILSDAKDILLLANIGSGVASDLVLPLVVGTEGVTVTWESDTPTVVTNAGVVFRQPEHTSVVLTATLHFNGQSVTKEFEFIVLRFAEFVEVADLAAAIEWFQTGVSPDPEVPINYYVKIPGVTLFGRTSEGFMFGDATGISFAYTQSEPNKNWVVGGVYDIYGLLAFFNGNIQLDGTKDIAQPIQMIASDATATVLTPTVVTDINAYIASLPTAYATKATPLAHQYIQLTAKVKYQSMDNYHTMFVNPDYVGADINTAISSPFTTNALIVYYRSNNTAFIPFDGLTITVNVFLYSLRNDRNLYTVIFTGTEEDIEFTLTDTELVDLVGDIATQNIPVEIIENSTLSLPTSILGTTVSWTSTNEALVNPSTGAVVMPTVGQTIVTLTATVTKDAVTKEFAVVITVGELEIITVAEALALPVSSKVRMMVTVTGVIANQTYAIQDATGAMAVFAGSSGSATWLTYVGKTIELTGTRAAFNGLQQVNPLSVVVGDVTSLPAFTNIDGVALDNTGLLPFQSMFVTRTGLEVVSVTNPSFAHLEVALIDPVTNETIKMYWDSRIATGSADQLNALVAGDSVNLIGIPVGWTSAGARFNYTNPSQVVVVVFVPTTDQEKVDAAAAALAALPETVTSNITLTLEAAGLYDTVVTWASSDEAVITSAGVVTVPFDQVSVTMTATVTLNAATTTRQFVVIVRENVVTIAVARTLAVNDKVIVEGLVTSVAVATDGRVVAFIQDATAGIYLYKIPAADASKVVVGNIIRVYGDAALHNGLKQIDTFTNVVVVSTGNAVTPEVVTDPALLSTLHGEVVQVSGYLREVVTSGSNFYLITDQGQFQLRLVSSSDLATVDIDSITAKLYNVPAGTLITVVAGVGNFNTAMQMMLFDADDITIGTLGTDAQLLAAAVANLALPVESAEQINNLTLPATGYFGTTVVWASNNEAVISTAGVVTRPVAGTSDVMVVLTYTTTLNAAVLEGTLNFTVLAVEDTSGEPELQLLYTYDFGATTQFGYAAGELTFTNADTSVATITKNRAQINTHSVDNGTPSLVFAPVSGNLVSFAEFNLSSITDIKKIEFSLATWSGTSFTNISALVGATFQLEFYNSVTTSWEPLQTTTEVTNILSLANATTYTTVSYLVTQPGLYRISYVLESASSTTNTAYAVCVDNFKIYN